MKRIQIVWVLLVVSQNLFSQKLPCSNGHYREFDFWIGEWEAFDPKGNKAGDSKISLLLDSCTILEEWTNTKLQNGFRFSGKSYNMYNAAEKQWQQFWVDNTGNVTAYSIGRFDEAKMILETPNLKMNDTLTQIQRMTFYHLSNSKVRQHGELSNDNGKTWTLNFDLEYRRKKEDVAIAIDSILRAMELAYSNKNAALIASYYAKDGKVIGNKTEISGRENMIRYWRNIVALGGTWKLTNEKTEKTGDLVWQKGTSVIKAGDGKEHTVKFTLIFIQENGIWKILQDTYW